MISILQEVVDSSRTAVSIPTLLIKNKLFKQNLQTKSSSMNTNNNNIADEIHCYHLEGISIYLS